MSANTVFLVNPASANGKTGKRWPKLRRRAAELGLDGDIVMSEQPGHLTQLARDIAKDYDLLVVVGGDGTLNEVANGVAGSGAEIAVLPAGTGQDFGRTHGIPPDFDAAVRIALDGTATEIDLVRAVYAGGERHFVNVGSVGMSGAVAKRANSMSKALGGRATFYYALAREFATWRNSEVSLDVDGIVHRGRMHDVIVANGQWHAGGMRLAPNASADDGLLDVIVVGDVTKLDFITTSSKLYSGAYLQHPRVDSFRGAAASVTSDDVLPVELDGEPVGTTPVRFEAVSRALRVRLPG